MLIVIFLIFLVMIGIGLILIELNDGCCEDTEGLGIATTLIGGMAECFVVIFIIVCAVDISTLKISDSKIKMYQEENNNIQAQINEIVTNYMDYEQNTYAQSLEKIDIGNTDLVVLTQLYPNLKSNEMVNTQIQIYQENNKKIKELKEQKLDKQVSKWWLYFGSAEKE